MSITQRDWLIDTEDWAYEEMIWSDVLERPALVRWRFRDLAVEIRGLVLHVLGGRTELLGG